MAKEFHPNLDRIGEQLAEADTIPSVMQLAGSAARALAKADGATFVLQEGDFCFYADEEAIGPLWKGRRFPKTSCISGWVMMYGQPAVIENIREDPRIPIAVYEPTFVQSLAMVPVRAGAPLAAIGVYWARRHRLPSAQLELLQTLAAHTAAALDRLNVTSRFPTGRTPRSAQGSAHPE